MKKTMICLGLALLLVVMGCQAAVSPLRRVETVRTKFNSDGEENFFLDSNGKLYISGCVVEDDIEKGNMSRYGLKTLTEKQMAELPEELKSLLNEENQITGTYNYILAATDVLDYRAAGRNIFKKDGRLYSWRGGDRTCKDANVTVGEDKLALMAEQVLKICNTSPLTFILEDGSVIVASRDNFYAQIEGAELWTGPLGQKMTKVAANAVDASGYPGHNFAYVDTNGILYMCGYNDFGLLGNGRYDEVLSTQYQIKDEEGKTQEPEGYSLSKFYKVMDKVTKIQIEGQNAFAWRTDGSVWSWGANEHGNCGLGTAGDGYPDTRDVVTKPQKLLDNCRELLGTIYGFPGKVWENAFLALSEDGTLYGWGSNIRGVAGNGEQSMTTKEFLPVNSPQKILSGVKDVTLSLGLSAYTALLENGDVYCWGFSTLGNAGCGIRAPGRSRNGYDAEYANFTPTKILSDGYMLSEICGKTSVVKKDGSIWSWGDNPFGWTVNDNYVDSSRVEDSTYGPAILIFASPVKNPQISAIIGADGSVSFKPAPIE